MYQVQEFSVTALLDIYSRKIYHLVQKQKFSSEEPSPLLSFLLTNDETMDDHDDALEDLSYTQSFLLVISVKEMWASFF